MSARVNKLNSSPRVPGHSAVGYEAQSNRVSNRGDDDGNGRGLPFQREGGWGSGQHDGGGIEAYQLLASSSYDLV
jgi:hypothetical protein